jgi:hypothetical protein
MDIKNVIAARLHMILDVTVSHLNLVLDINCVTPPWHSEAHNQLLCTLSTECSLC